jgi:2-phospho-L-lactate guanylyltransferase
VNDWTLIIPVKALASAKSRLAPELPPVVRAALARAFALDTIEAAVAAPSAARILVVTGEPELHAHLEAGVEVLYEAPGAGLTSAIEAGVATARREGEVAVAVLLGDLPAMRADGLESVLNAAARYPLAFVRDAEGTGSTLATARAGDPFASAFGEGSASRHLAAGFTDLVAVEHRAITPGARSDVDTLDALQQALQVGVGRHTAEVFAAHARSHFLTAPPSTATERHYRDPHARVQGIR